MQKKNCPNISPNHLCLLVKYTIYRIELPHFKIGSAYGGTQEWCPTYWMNIGGCAAIAPGVFL